MRFIQGRTLSDAIQTHHRQPTALGLRQLLQRFIAVCQTVAYAHSKHVIHRDLKPDNVMLGDYGETLVVDWGLAKVIKGPGPESSGPGEPGAFATGAEDSPAGDGLGQTVDCASAAAEGSKEPLTVAGQVLGTPAYMAPEQARGATLGPAADIYALGAVLYNLLTGKSPYQGRTALAVIQQVLAGPPPTPLTHRRGMPRALNAICLKAMGREADQRYATAAELARDVERWLADEPVTAYREPLPARLARWGRRHRTLVTATVLVLLTLIGAAVVGGLVVGREQERARVLAHADALPDAGAATVPALLSDLEAHRDVARRRLWARWQDPGLTNSQRLRLGLALADDAEVRAQLVALVRTADDPQEVLLARDALAPHAAVVAPLLWGPVAETATSRRERLRLLAILATLDPDNERWAAGAGDAVSALVRENVLHSGGWAEALRPVRGRLRPPLTRVFRDANRLDSERSLATVLLADYAADRPEELADLLMDADSRQFAVLFPKVQTHGRDSLLLLTREATEPDKERQARRQANAAVALLKMGQPGSVWPLLKHSKDPRVRSYLIHRLGPLGADAGAIVRQLGKEQDVTIQRALVLSLGPEEFGEEAWTPEAKKLLVEQLQEMYCTAADPGLHAAAEWLLKQWKKEVWLRQIDEGLVADKGQRDKRLERIREELRLAKEEAQPQWYVNGLGQTLVVIPGPVQFEMGSPSEEVGSLHPREQLHRRRIGRTFAIAAKPITVKQYLQFDRSKANDYSTELAPSEDCPMHSVSWYMAAAYCNWLSKQDGIPEEDWCYEPNKGKYEDGMTLAPDYLKRTGYRLPTEAEWEYACRAGTITSRYCGETEQLLGKYGRYLRNSGDRSWPVGSLKPNDLGLFDMHGNLWAWCQERYREYPKSQGQEPIDDMDDSLVVDKDENRVLRGGAFDRPAVFVRSAHRDFNAPGSRFARLGFRVARTFR
jgi:formylglycine-generating enzyme required for sulfatase activity